MTRLTKKIVDAAVPRQRPYFIWCGELSGFGLRVFPSGKRTYYADYRNRDGVRRRMALGPHGKLTADEARKLAVVAFAGALKGGDPAAERATRRNTLTVGELCDKYMQAAEGGLIVGKRGRPKKASTLYNDQGPDPTPYQAALGNQASSRVDASGREPLHSRRGRRQDGGGGEDGQSARQGRGHGGSWRRHSLRRPAGQHPVLCGVRRGDPVQPGAWGQTARVQSPHAALERRGVQGSRRGLAGCRG